MAMTVFPFNAPVMSTNTPVPVTVGALAGKVVVAIGGNFALTSDGKLFALSEEGKLTVIKTSGAGGEWEILSVNDLGEAAHATPAIADGKIYVRTHQTLYCFAQTP